MYNPLDSKSFKPFILLPLLFTIIFLHCSIKVSASNINKNTSHSIYLNFRKHTISLRLLKMNNKLDNRITKLTNSNKDSSKKTLYSIDKNNYTKKISRSITVKKSINKNPVKNTDTSNLDLLARLVKAEAEGQPYKAQVAVAAVVLNRMKSSKFPNSIKSVIYDKSDGHYQFTPTANGFINKKSSSISLKAAKEALQGSDPSNGALYYFDDSTKNKWLLKKPKNIKIGNMIFAY